MKYSLLTILFLFSIQIHLISQEEDLLSLIEEEPVTDFATASFKTNRVINLHSLENTAYGVLDFKISHRFDPVNQGFYDIFGLDGATIRFGLDYGVTDRFQIGLGRTSWEKTYDGYLKYKLLRQSKGKVNMPVSMNLVTAASAQTLRDIDADLKTPFWDRFTYVTQLNVGRKFNSSFSLQLSPIWVHRNLVETREDKNDIFALALATRQKLTKRVSLNFEYVFLMPGMLPDEYKNSMSIGLDIETGGHVFQLHFLNSRFMVEKSFITETTKNLWEGSGIHFGFNISRVFTIRER